MVFFGINSIHFFNNNIDDFNCIGIDETNNCDFQSMFYTCEIILKFEFYF